MTDEHVIPDCIGGKLIIRACQACNSRLGQIVDPLLTRQANVRMMAIETRSGLSRLDRVKAKAMLHDGRLIDVFVAIIFEDKNHYRYECCPVTQQPDGSRWVPAEASNPRLPSDINVLRQEHIKKLLFVATDPPSTASPAIVKIVLGMLHHALGIGTLQRPEFNPMRSCLSGNIDPQVTVTPLPLGQQPTTAPKQPDYGAHLIWAECENGQTLTGGVSIFGRINYELTMPRFGTRFPGRCCESRAFTLGSVS
jgi:hypothetical protein